MRYLKNWRLLVIVGAFALVGGSLTFYISRSTEAKETTPGVQEVALTTNEATPSIVFVKVGESVQFNSRDGKDHFIGSGRGEEKPHTDESHGQAALNSDAHEHTEGINSGKFGPDEGFKVNFKKIGTYEFHDHLNPKLRITVVVYQEQ